jgi:hypothetical protein
MNLEPKPIVEQCRGCDRITKNGENREFCTTYWDPAVKWRPDHRCPMYPVHQIVNEAKRVNPLKASKRKAKGK